MNGYNAFKRTGSRKERRLFFITTEGLETEVNYIRELCRGARVSPTFKGGYGSGKQHVEKTIRTLKNESKEYEQIWCVFDKDEYTEKDLKSAIILASRKGIHVAYSSKCVELWFLLHFQKVTSDLDTKSILRKLNSHFQKEFGITYDKTNVDIYRLLEDRTHIAIQNAEQLFRSHSCELGPDIVDKSPITTLHLLVQTIL